MDWWIDFHHVSLPPPPAPACTYRNQECRLTIHYDNGFSISTEPQEGAFPKTIIQSPYEKLKMSSDDGIRMLYLDFGGKEGEIVSVGFLWPRDLVCFIMQHTCKDSETLGCLSAATHPADSSWRWLQSPAVADPGESRTGFSGVKQVQLSRALSFGFIFH